VYVGKTSEAAKQEIQTIFTKPTSHIRCLIASTAFGMGIDIPDIELVIHWGVSSTVLNYWQEVGRCGRDGRQGESIVLATPTTISDKHMTEACVRDLHEHITSGKACIRLSILNALYLECMHQGELDKVSHKDECEALCTPSTTCARTWCMCCSVCRLQCTCRSSGFQITHM
jgi:superfamily II DNA helicase RecQ